MASPPLSFAGGSHQLPLPQLLTHRPPPAMDRGSGNLCASCDRCRARKTKCDGNRPCGACVQKYLKKHKLTSAEGVDPSRFECFYSPAKRRGPVPGHKQSRENGRNKRRRNNNRKPPQAPRPDPAVAAAAPGTLSLQIAEDGSVTSTHTGGAYGGASAAGASHATGGGPGSSQHGNRSTGGGAPASAGYAGSGGAFPLLPPLDPNAAAMQQHVLSTLGTIGMNLFSTNNSSSSSNNDGGGAVGARPPAGLSVGQAASSGGQDTMATAQNAAQQQLAYIQQLQLQQQMQAQKQRRDAVNGENAKSNNFKRSASSGSRQSRQQSTPVPSVQSGTAEDGAPKHVVGCSNPAVVRYAPLLSPSDARGAHLRACHALSPGGLLGLPPLPTDGEYCRRFGPALEPHQLPKFDVAALQAARLAELAMGALADAGCAARAGAAPGRPGGLFLALANASVLCLRDCAEEPVHPSLMFDVARTYFFHAIFRARMDDMERYFKYRRVCLRYLAQLDGIPGVETLMAAISFQDSLSYMIYNASEADLPSIDEEIPRVSPPHDVEDAKTSDAEKKYGISTAPSRVASSPINQMWMQGAPVVLINEAAPPKSRILDALACAIRSSLDDANSRQTKEPQQSSRGRIISRKRKFLSDAEAKDKSATEWVVEHHPELSCSNLLAEASNLLKKEDDQTAPSLALPSIFGGHLILLSALDVTLNLDRITDDFHLQRILNVLEGMIQRPIVLFQGGPSYHIFNNCAVLLAHAVNKLRADGLGTDFARAQFDAAINVYNGARIALGKHRAGLPRRLRCHEIPGPNAGAADGASVIDLTDMALCRCRNCQDCVAPGIPAKEVAKRAPEGPERDGWPRSEAEEEFDVNDRALLSLLSRIITQEESA